MKLLDSWRKSLAQRNLKVEVAALIDTAEGHRKCGLPPGHNYFKRLYAQAFDKISAYTKENGGTRDDIAMMMPKLKVLADLADGHTQNNIPRYVIATAVLGVVLTVYFGFTHIIYTYITHWAR